jgi:hypothetical protein
MKAAIGNRIDLTPNFQPKIRLFLGIYLGLRNGRMAMHIQHRQRLPITPVQDRF